MARLSQARTKTIRTDALARVEGEGAMRVRIEAGRVTEVALDIYEPPRFFEAFLRGRDFTEAPDITSRICGICPVAYQMSAVHGDREPLRRRSSTGRCARCGGCSTAASGSRATRCTSSCCTRPTSSAMRARSRWRAITRRSSPTRSKLKKAGNEVMRVVGGREIHPINMRVGGFHRAPRKARARDAGRAAQARARRSRWARSR